MAKSYKLVGADDLIADLENFGKITRKNLKAIVHQAVNPVLRTARSHAPVDTGNLKRGIKLLTEHSKNGNKVVYQVTMDSSMNDIFVKYSRDGKRSYYPSSQEYGYRTKNKGYIPGFHFMRNALESNYTSSTELIKKPIEEAFDKTLGGTK